MSASAEAPAARSAGRSWWQALGAACQKTLVLLFTLALTYLGLLAATFFIGRVIPVDPALAVAGDRAPEHVLQRVRQELGLDQPLWTQFSHYVGQVLRGDLGSSILTSNPVLEDLLKTFPATFELASAGIIIGVGVGVPLGVWAALHQGRWPDHLARLLGLMGHSIPIFWLGLMGLLLFYAQLGWVSGPGRLDVVHEFSVPRMSGLLLLDTAWAGQWEAFGNALSHLALPASLLGFYALAYISRMTRAFMLNELSKEYILTARAKGLAESRVVWWHALRNAAVPLVTVVALSYAALLEGSVLTETVFAWPGLGLYITHSLQNGDMNAVLGGTLLVGSLFIALNLLSDVLYRLLDPRVRAP